MQLNSKTLKICLAILCLLPVRAVGLPQLGGANFFMELIKDQKTGKIISEVWKPICGYEGLYSVSNYGRVKSLNRIIVRKNGAPQKIHERILSPGKVPADYGYYLTVMLCNHGIDKMFLIHVLVAKAFLKRIKGKNEVNHLDEVKHNNVLWNLEWNNHHENNTYRKKNKTSKYYGVHWSTKAKKWVAVIGLKGDRKYLGSYKSERYAYNKVRKAMDDYNIINKYL